MDKKIWTKALLSSVKAPVTLTGKKIDDKIIVEFTKQPNDASWDYNVHQWSYNDE
ncbi:dynobactin A family peptide antibiotic [Citrobacter portucalensis]|uniref:dynobactin A family peptide antibiotic n=1 Tax=Citrobacter portucalensis TaxID=1639133 RepID=UPI003CF526EF